jgi:excinuclease ABC subunit A
MSWFRDELVNKAYKFDFPIHKPYYQLSEDQKANLEWK